MGTRKHRVCGLLALLAGAAWSQVTTFDAATNLVTIPSVSVGAVTYRNVKLQHLGNYVFALADATLEQSSPPGTATYDLFSGVLDIPAVRVGEATFVDVKLLNVGNFTFTLQAAAALPAATLDAARAFMAGYDAQWASKVPASGSARMVSFDGCYRGDGRTRSYIVADTDGDLAGYAAREAYQVGRSSGNLQVLALRNITNPDGSSRQEIELQYDVTYADGSQALGAVSTLVSGNSSGVAGCSTPTNSTALRFLGNQHLVQVNVNARNTRDQRHSLASGAALSPAVNHRRSLQFQIVDPMGNAKYAVLSGTGPSAIVGGTERSFSLKFISPRLLRSAPELLGKPGNYLNWLDDDAWRYCRISGSGIPVAEIADCVGQGATAYELGVTTSTPNAAADQSFEELGFRAGAYYRVDLYDDDGWKTVNGHAGRTPLATYHAQLDQLPYTFVDMAATATRFPRLAFGSLSTAQVATNITSATPGPMRVTWNAPTSLTDTRRFALYQGWEFQQGPRTGNAGGAALPGYRVTNFNYPGSLATLNAAWAISPKLAEQASKSYSELTLMYLDRNGSQILSLVSFQ